MTEKRLQKIKAVLQKRQCDITVVFENIHDPHNVSAILRTCDAVGIYKVHLLYTVEPFPHIGEKSSSSAKKWVEKEKWKNYEECFSSLKKEGFSILGTTLSPESKSLYSFDLTQKVAIVLGNEHRGISPQALQYCDATLFIPMTGMIQSLNVSVAGAVILYEAFRQREHKGMYDRSLDKKMFEKMMGKWGK